MLTYNSVFNASHRHVDKDNGYLYVDESPVLRAGILEYLGEELLPEGWEDLPENDLEVDGKQIDPQKIYKVKIPVEEIEKAKDTFALIPLCNDHTWLGKEGKNAKDYQEGSTGQDVFVKNGMLYCPLKWTNLDTVEQILKGEKEELSASYNNRIIASNDDDCDFIAVDLHGNHIALVDKGRCGEKVRVLNNAIKESKMANEKEESFIDIDALMKDEPVEDNDKEKETGADVAPSEAPAETKGAEDDSKGKESVAEEIKDIIEDELDEETVKEIVAKVEELEAQVEEKTDTPAEDDKDKTEEKKEETKSENSDFPNLDAVLDWAEVDGKACAEALAKWIGEIELADFVREYELGYEEEDEDTENSAPAQVENKCENTCKAQNKKLTKVQVQNAIAQAKQKKLAYVKTKAQNKSPVETSKKENDEDVYTKAFNSAMEKVEEKQKSLKKAYNDCSKVLGHFNPFGMNEKDMYVKAVNSLGIELCGNESTEEMSAMLKAGIGVQTRVDNSFRYEVSQASEETNFNF